ncbi:hypothetical protein HY772_04500 [Candidatus Woesearchaeota archaeon]|nr:hypothetical protein [Candidatus Woesearchaeota archaeon]
MKAHPLLYTALTAAIVACAPAPRPHYPKSQDPQDPLPALASEALHRVQTAGGEISVQEEFGFQYVARARDLNHDVRADFSCSLTHFYSEYSFIAEDTSPVGSLDGARRCLKFGKKKCAILDTKDPDVRSLYTFCLEYAAGNVQMPWHIKNLPALSAIEKKKDLAQPAPLQEIVSGLYADIRDNHLDYVDLGSYSLILEKVVVEGKRAVALQLSRNIGRPLLFIDTEPFGQSDKFYQCRVWDDLWFLLMTPLLCNKGRTPSQEAHVMYDQAMRAAAEHYYDRGKQGNYKFEFNKNFDSTFDLLYPSVQ